MPNTPYINIEPGALRLMPNTPYINIDLGALRLMPNTPYINIADRLGLLHLYLLLFANY